MYVKPEMFPDVSGWGRGSGAAWPGVDRGLPLPRAGLRLFIIRSNCVSILLVLGGIPVPTQYTYLFLGLPYHLDNVWIAAERSGHHLTGNSFVVLRSNFLGKEQIGLEDERRREGTTACWMGIEEQFWNRSSRTSWTWHRRTIKRICVCCFKKIWLLKNKQTNKNPQWCRSNNDFL